MIVKKMDNSYVTPKVEEILMLSDCSFQLAKTSGNNHDGTSDTNEGQGYY